MATWWMVPAAFAAAALVWWLPMPNVDPAPNMPPRPDDGPAWRGDVQSQTLRSPNPAAAAEHLAALLNSHQVATRQASLATGAILLQAKIPASATALRQALSLEGIQVPAHGRLDLTITRD